jgi:uncharacterized membrane protein
MPTRRYRLGRTALIGACIAWLFGASAIVILLSIIAGYLIITSDDVR